MMIEKRFVLNKLVEKGNSVLSVRITDNISNNNYFIMTKEAYEDDIDEIVDLLNKQQATIEQLQYLCGENNSENTKSRMKISDETWAVIEQMIGVTMLLIMVFLVLFLITVIIQLTLGYVIWE